MSIAATALEMRIRIKRLMREQHCTEPTPCDLPLTDPVDRPQIMVGWASTCHVDADRTRLRPYAFGWPLMFRNGYPPLLFRHDPAQVAGEIQDLYYSEHGELMVKARVDHPVARRSGAFSIAARVLAYSLHNADRADFYAEVTQAELTEISITSAPANPHAVVTQRYSASPVPEFYDLMTRRVSRLSQLTQLIRQEMNPWNP